jgi:hypothetical protein
MKEAPGSSETAVLTRATRRNNPEDTILHSSLVHIYISSLGACGSVVRLGTALQAGRFWVSFPMALDFPLHPVLPVALWP